MTDQEGEDWGSGQRSLGVPDAVRDVRGPRGQTAFPRLHRPTWPSAPDLGGFILRLPDFPAARCSWGIAQCDLSSGPRPRLPRPRPLCPWWLGASRLPTAPCVPGMPSAGAAWPRLLRPGRLGSEPADFPPPRAPRACPVWAQPPRSWERPGGSRRSGAEEPSRPRWARVRPGPEPGGGAAR